MIPRRIAVKGFLCYREEQEVCFDDTSLWMLAGPNGSGKSSLFDAMTYALFGHHRAGQRNSRELVNKHSDGLQVEFDFLLDDLLYQARRTLRCHSNRTTRQLRRWAPGEGRGAGQWEEVPGTDNEEGFAEWVRDHLGMTYETFTSSVLLLQGKAERLLDADPKERRRALGNIVGLHRYENLFARADERRKELLAESRVLQHQLDGMPEVSRNELREATRQVRAVRAACARAAARVENLGSLSLALPWLRRLHQDRERLHQAVRDQAVLRIAAQAGQTEREQLHAEQAGLIQKLQAARLVRQQAEQRVMRAEALLNELRRRAGALESMAGEPTCRSCGQELSAAHLQTEKARLAREEVETVEQHRQAALVLDAAIRAETQIGDDHARVARILLETGNRLAGLEYQQQELGRLSERAVQECNQAYGELPVAYRVRVNPALPENWLTTTFPSRPDLQDLQDGAEDLGPDQIRKQLEAARWEQALYEEQLRRAEQQQRCLLERWKQRSALRVRCLDIDRRHRHYQLLAELLGPKRLQLFLVRQAERRIMAYTNAILDRLSSGQLFLRLRGEDSDDGAADRALDLEAFDRAVAGATPFNVRLLSGSQRFRVAVSLALGIGQYAGRHHRPVEAVIIDEGFGCLDREGRQAMIQELLNLRGHLRCILLVSHQEEFADAFGNGYRFAIEDGSTRVTRFQR